MKPRLNCKKRRQSGDWCHERNRCFGALLVCICVLHLLPQMFCTHLSQYSLNLPRGTNRLTFEYEQRHALRRTVLGPKLVILMDVL